MREEGARGLGTNPKFKEALLAKGALDIYWQFHTDCLLVLFIEAERFVVYQEEDLLLVSI